MQRRRRFGGCQSRSHRCKSGNLGRERGVLGAALEARALCAWTQEGHPVVVLWGPHAGKACCRGCWCGAICEECEVTLCSALPFQAVSVLGRTAAPRMSVVTRCHVSAAAELTRRDARTGSDSKHALHLMTSRFAVPGCLECPMSGTECSGRPFNDNKRTTPPPLFSLAAGLVPAEGHHLSSIAPCCIEVM